MSEFKLTLTHFLEQWEAYCRDWIEKQGEDEMCKFVESVISETESTDPRKALTAYFALVGIVSTWVQVD